MIRLEDLTDRAMRLRAEKTPPTFGELVGEDVDVEELAELWVSAREWKTCAAAVEKAISTELAGLLKGRRGVEVSGHLVFYGTQKKEVCVDPEGFAAWLANNPSLIARVFNANTARKGSVPPAARETFFEKQKTGKAELSAVPVEVLETNRQKKELARG